MKKLILSFGLLLCILTCINAQDVNSDFGSGSIMGQVPNPVLSPDVTYYGQWYPSATFPTLPSASFYTCLAMLGDTLYAHLPSSTGASSTTIVKARVNAGGWGSSAWTTGRPLPTALVGGAMVACGNKVFYIGGGSTITTGGTTVYEYSPTTGVWATRAPLPLGRTGHNAVAWGDSVIFVMCGPWSTTTGTNLQVFRYRVATNTWTTLTGTNALPTGAGKRSAAAGLFGNKIIISAGYAGAFLNTTFVGTIGSTSNTITWTTAPNHPAPSGGLSRVGGTACYGYFFTIGGEKNGGGYEDVNYTFNFQDNAWVYTWTSLKPTGTSNIWNGNTSKLFSSDTIKIFSVGAYNGAAQNAFQVARFKATFCVGINGTNDNHIVTIYPNPANNMINLYLNNTQTDAVAEIYNTSGQLVKNYQLLTGNNVIDLTTLTKGVYFVTVKGNNLLTTEKIVVN